MWSGCSVFVGVQLTQTCVEPSGSDPKREGKGGGEREHDPKEGEKHSTTHRRRVGMKLPPCSWDHLRFLGRFGRSKGNPQSQEERRTPNRRRKEKHGRPPRPRKEGQRKTNGRPTLSPPLFPSQPPHILCFGAPVPSLSLFLWCSYPTPFLWVLLLSFFFLGRAAVTLLLFFSSWGSGWAAPTPRRKEKEGRLEAGGGKAAPPHKGSEEGRPPKGGRSVGG